MNLQNFNFNNFCVSTLTLVTLGSLFMLSIAPSELTVSDNANAVYGGCYTTKAVYDGTCREEVGCGEAGCLPLDASNPNTAYVCNSSIPTEGAPDTPRMATLY